MRNSRTIAGVLALVGSLSSCQVLPSLTCSADLSLRLTPSERTISVGESFTPEATFFGCGGDRRLEDVITWAADDLGIVSVDPKTGRTTGRAPGQTFVTPTGERYGKLASVRVTVRAGS